MPQTLLRSEDLHGWVNGTLGELSLAAGCGTDQYNVDPILPLYRFHLAHPKDTHTHQLCQPCRPQLNIGRETPYWETPLRFTTFQHKKCSMTIYTVGCHSIGKSSICVNYINIVLVDIYILDIFFGVPVLKKQINTATCGDPLKVKRLWLKKGNVRAVTNLKKKWVKTKTNLMAWQEFNLSICCALPICQSWLTTPIGRNLVLGLGDVFLFSHKCDLGYSKIFKKTHRNSHKASQSMFFPFGVLKNPLYRIHIHIYNIYSWVEPPHSRKKCGDSTQICLSTGTWNSF